MAQENQSGLINKKKIFFCTQLNINKQSVNFKNPSSSYPKMKIICHQLNLIRRNRKIKFYSIFKNETNYSEFINHIRNPEHRHVAFKLRIGNHN